MSHWKQRATHLAGEVYDALLQDVVEAHVLNEREGVLSERAREGITRGTHIDPRAVRLMTLSGKGGWHPDPGRRAKYAASINVTLLDHLLSVARGALVLYALDALGRNPEMEEALLKRRLRVIAVLAFLHDLDKLLSLARNTALPLDEIDAALARYGLSAFLSADALSADQWRYLIEKVEDTQTHTHPPVTLPPRDFDRLPAYVALADKLDGIWLSTGPEGGTSGVLEYLRKTRVLNVDVLQNWRAVDIFDPHHPFLLDELHRWLSFFSLRFAGVPPLIEVHHDGRLFVLLPREEHASITDAALRRLGDRLPFALELNISNRGAPALYNGQPDYAELQAFVARLPLREIARLFLLKADLRNVVTGPLDALLGPIGLAPRWSRTSGALVTPYALVDGMGPETEDPLRRAALLVMLLNLNIPNGKAVPDYAAREQELIGIVGREVPAWIQAVTDGASRRSLLGLWTLVVALNDTELNELVWGKQGLLARWLEGKGEQPGFNLFIEGRGARVVKAVREHFQQLLSERRLVVENEQAQGRCLFTDEPVPSDEVIDEALGLYEVKVSAFSGRDYRPESLTTDVARTNVGPVSVAEHKLRTRAHANAGGRADGVPSLISSPATLGLFGGLVLTSDAALRSLSIYDLRREEIKKGTVYLGGEVYRDRYRVARFERMAEKAADQIDQLRLLLQACRRLGRPLHVFRGLPTLQPAFFYYDALPRALEELIGGRSLRLEQFPEALHRLAIGQTLLEAPGLGYDVLQLYAARPTRFSAVCLAASHLRDRLDQESAGEQQGGWRAALAQLTDEFQHLWEDQSMSNDEGALVRLGRAAARIQRRPAGRSSANEELLVFKICMEAAEIARAAGQDDEASLINGVASELEINLIRKDQQAARKHREDKPLRQGCLELAELFVREIWNGVLKRRPPTQRIRRVLGSIYRMSFLQTARIAAEPEQDQPIAANP
jgi:hypothetical protein